MRRISLILTLWVVVRCFVRLLTGFLDWLAGCAYLCVFLVATTTATTVCHMTRGCVVVGSREWGRARFEGPSVGIAVHNVITSAGGMGEMLFGGRLWRKLQLSRNGSCNRTAVIKG